MESLYLKLKKYQTDFGKFKTKKGYSMKGEIKRLEKIKNMVISMYTYTESITQDTTRDQLEEYLIKLSFDIESTSNFILDEIKDIKKNIN